MSCVPSGIFQPPTHGSGVLYSMYTRSRWEVRDGYTHTFKISPKHSHTSYTCTIARLLSITLDSAFISNLNLRVISAMKIFCLSCSIEEPAEMTSCLHNIYTLD